MDNPVFKKHVDSGEFYCVVSSDIVVCAGRRQGRGTLAVVLAQDKVDYILTSTRYVDSSRDEFVDCFIDAFSLVREHVVLYELFTNMSLIR